MRRLTVLLLILLFSKYLSAQEKLFDISFLGKKIGDLKIERIEISPIRETINSINEIAIKSMIINRWSKTILNTLWENKTLIESDFTYKSESVFLKVKTIFNKNHYLIKTDSVQKILRCEPIKCSTNRLFFEEPKNQTHVYSERLTKFLPLAKLGNNEYSFTADDGAVNIYKYRNGGLYEIEIRKRIGTGYVRLVTKN
jgi:hypothetical protein